MTQFYNGSVTASIENPSHGCIITTVYWSGDMAAGRFFFKQCELKILQEKQNKSFGPGGIFLIDRKIKTDICKMSDRTAPVSHPFFYL